MKLTKDDFLIYNERYEGLKPLFDEKNIEQILENMKIVERLEKELPEIYEILDSYDEWGWTTKIKTKLQKILDTS